MNNKIYAQMLMVALIGSFSDMQARDVGQGISSIPELGEKLSGGETAVFEGEPGLPIFRSKPNQTVLGSRTDSKPPVNLITNTIQPNSGQTTGIRTPDTRPPMNFDENNLEGLKKLFEERSNFDDIKTGVSSEFTDEDILKGLADMFKEDSQVLEEPALDTSVVDYLNQLGDQIETLNDELEKMLSHTKLNELHEKCPLLIDQYVDTSTNYPDLMHSGNYVNAPDTGEVKPIKDISF